ncbi:MAG: WG repeat-containing protein [Cyanobacteriota bacterium]
MKPSFNYSDLINYKELSSTDLLVVIYNGKYGYIDRSGNIVIEPNNVFTHAQNFSEGLALVTTGEQGNIHSLKRGYIDINGDFAIESAFYLADHFSEGLAPVAMHNFKSLKAPIESGYINKQGNWIIKDNRFFQKPGRFKDNIAIVCYFDENSGYQYSFINRTGEFVFNFGFDYLTQFSEGLAVAQKSQNKYGFINKDGIFTIHQNFYEAEPFSDGLACVRPDLQHGYGFIDKAGDYIIDPIFDSARSFSDGMAVVEINNKFGFINKSGKLSIKNFYDSVLEFNEGLAPVKINDKWGYIDISGNLVIDYNFDDAFNFTKGLSVVRINNKWGYLKPDGSYLWVPSA